MNLPYALAWLAYMAVYFLVFRMMGLGAPDAVAGALANGLPGAVLGVGPLRHAIGAGSRQAESAVRGSLPWRHAAFALLFAAACVAATMLIGLVHRAREQGEGAFDPPRWMFRSALDVFLLLHHATAGLDFRRIYDPTVLIWQGFIALLIYAILAAVGHAIGSGRSLREEEARSRRAELLRAQAEAQVLRSQLDPHFLFNTLHSLLALVRVAPARAERALEQFGDLMRYSLRMHETGSDEVRLREEMAFVDTYLELESLRLGDRLRVVRDLDPDALDEVVPAFCLQPLVENAILHAVAPRAGATTVCIAARREGGDLVLEVSDDGPGARMDAGNGIARGEAERSGLGLRLIRERLRTTRGAGAQLAIATSPGAGFRVTARLPLARADRVPA